MLYLISETKNSFGLVEYDHARSIDYSLFSEGLSLQNLESDPEIIFEVTKKSNIAKLRKRHFINSTGPILVSREFQSVLERAAPGDAEFYDASIRFGVQEISGFSCLNPLRYISCMDMEKSEYQKTNFDAENPTYMFMYMHLREQLDEEPGIALCKEQRSRLVVNDRVKQACVDADLKGLAFYRALDLTYGNRTV